MSNNNNQKQFEERSDYIQTEDLLTWNVENDHFSQIQSELNSTSIKLLVGPRGTGKTHQMKIYQESCKENVDMPICVYVSFTKYFYLEPYLAKKSNAIQIFHSWVLSKLLLAYYELTNDTTVFNEYLKNARYSFDLDGLIEFIALSERGLVKDNSEIQKELSINSLILILNKIMTDKKRKRCVILFDDAALTLTQDYMIEFQDGSVQSGLEVVKELNQKSNPGSTFSYSFISDEVSALYQKEKRLSTTYILFTIIALLISAIGLFTIALYDTQRRVKEIGVRKVNGASIIEILLMLNKDFIKWVGISFVIACPIAYYLMHSWLENFAYKTALSWWVFALAGGFTLVVSLITVSWQTYKAATQNPVESLRDE